MLVCSWVLKLMKNEWSVICKQYDLIIIYNIKNKKGPRIELCGNPVIPDIYTTEPDDVILFTSTLWDLWLRYKEVRGFSEVFVMA